MPTAAASAIPATMRMPPRLASGGGVGNIDRPASAAPEAYMSAAARPRARHPPPVRSLIGPPWSRRCCTATCRRDGPWLEERRLGAGGWRAGGSMHARLTASCGVAVAADDDLGGCLAGRVGLHASDVSFAAGTDVDFRFDTNGRGA